MACLAAVSLLLGVFLNTAAHNLLLSINHDCSDCDVNGTWRTVNQQTPEWSSLKNTALELFQIQNDFDTPISDLKKNVILIILHDSLTWKLAVTFIEAISALQPETKHMDFNFGTAPFIQTIIQAIENLMMNEVYISSVVIFSSDVQQITQLLDSVSGHRNLTWTSIIHITEWIVVSSSNDLQAKIQIKEYALDFVTLVYIYRDHTHCVVAQKSRNSRFTINSKLLIQKREDNNEERQNRSRISNVEKEFRFINCRCQIRPHPLRYLMTKTSDMAGLRLLAAFPENGYARTVNNRTVGNTTVFDGFSVAVMNLMASILGFELNFTFVTDGGDYGEVLGNGTVTGLTGTLARREATMACLMSRLESRQQVIDFLPTPLLVESANIVYRLPKAREAMDITYVTIFKPEFLLSLVGPLILIAILAIVVHVSTLSCTVLEPRTPSVHGLRKLNDCTENICFHHRREYLSQTARILRASWSVFCLIMVSAYSAFLVTTFTVKREEFKIRTFQELLARSDFAFGMHGSSKALPIILKTSTDKWLRETWNKLVEFNKTNPMTFTLDFPYHIKRIMEGRYAFLDNFSIGSGEFYDYVSVDETDIRAYPQNSLQGLSSSFIAIPQHVFFKETLYKAHLKLERSGLVLKLQEMYFSRKSKPNINKANSESIAVDLHRIQLIMFVAFTGIVISCLCLAAEFAVSWWRKRDISFK